MNTMKEWIKRAEQHPELQQQMDKLNHQQDELLQQQQMLISIFGEDWWRIVPVDYDNAVKTDEQRAAYEKMQRIDGEIRQIAQQISNLRGY
jgi:hypothetical protein